MNLDQNMATKDKDQGLLYDHDMQSSAAKTPILAAYPILKFRIPFPGMCRSGSRPQPTNVRATLDRSSIRTPSERLCTVHVSLIQATS